MPLNTTLNTNEIKDASAAEVEFSRIRAVDRSVEYAKIGEQPNLEYRLKVSHQEAGSNSKRRRRSVVRFDKTVVGADALPVTVSAYAVLDFPVGNLSADTEAKNVLANLMSFLATTGAGTTVLFDCSGSGAAALTAGSL